MITLTDVQEVSLLVAGESAAGNPAALEGIAVTSSDETVITVSTGEAENEFWLSSTGKVGTSQIQVKADARIGPGVSELLGVETLNVVGGEAIKLNLQFGEPSDR